MAYAVAFSIPPSISKSDFMSVGIEESACSRGNREGMGRSIETHSKPGLEQYVHLPQAVDLWRFYASSSVQQQAVPSGHGCSPEHFAPTMRRGQGAAMAPHRTPYLAGTVDWQGG